MSPRTVVGAMRGTAGLACALTALMLVPAGTAQLFGEEESFWIAEPHVGDQGRYAVLDALPTNETDEDANASVAFQLGAQETQLDAYGRERTVWPMTLAPDPIVETDLEELRNNNATFWYPRTAWLPGQGEGAARVDAFGGGYRVSRSGNYITGSSQAHHAVQTQGLSYATPRTHLEGDACLLVPGFQGIDLQEDDPLDLGDFCGGTLLREASEAGVNLKATVTAIETRDEVPDTMQAEIVTRGDGRSGTLALTYQEGIAYPVEILLETTPFPEEKSTSQAWVLSKFSGLVDHLARGAGGETQLPAGAPLTAHLRLTNFQAGNGDTLPPADPLTWPDEAAVEMAPVDRWGPMSGDSSFRYPLREAVEAIKEDPEMIQFHRWLEEHPSAWATWIEYEETETERGTASTWRLHFEAEDQASRSVRSTKHPNPAGDQLPDPADAALIENEDGLRVPGFSESSSAVGCQPAGWGPPDRAPTVGAVLDRWDQFGAGRAEGDTPNTFTWHASTCSDHIGIEAGWRLPDRQRSPLDPDPEHQRSNESAIRVSPEDGAVTDVLLYKGERSSRGMSPLGPSSAVSETETPTPDRAEPSISGVPPLAGAATATGLIAAIVLLLAKLGLLPFYSRIEDEELLDHPLRRQLLEVLEAEPGLRLADLARRIDVDRSTADHHLAKLEEAGFVRHVGTNGASRWFVAGQLPPETIEAEAVLATGDTREIYAAIQDEPGTSLSRLADSVDKHPSSVHRVVERLIEAGLVDKRREGRSVALTPADQATSA